jgi:hypothetical protein
MSGVASPPAAAPRRPERGTGAAPATADFDLHGLVGIRLVDALPREEAAVAAQLGPIRAPLHREPDIVIRFVDRLPLSAPPRLLGVDDAGFTDDAFLVMRGKHKSAARVIFPMETVGGRCEIVCERGLAAVPLLVAAVNLTALSRGVLPMHAAAFRYRGAGVLVTGWSKGGKTETLLGFMAAGAEYVGDEWVYLDADGETMYGIPEPIRLWDWHLAELPLFRQRLPRGTRARLRALEHLAGWLERAAPGAADRPSKRRRDVHRLLHLVNGQRHVDLPPHRLFAPAAAPMRAPLDRVVLVGSHEAPEIRVERLDPGEVARRMAFSLQEERSELAAYYRRFRFAHPGLRNPLLEDADRREAELLLGVLAGKPCHGVFHPYPVSIPALFEAVRPLVES